MHKGLILFVALSISASLVCAEPTMQSQELAQKLSDYMGSELRCLMYQKANQASERNIYTWPSRTALMPVRVNQIYSSFSKDFWPRSGQSNIQRAKRLRREYSWGGKHSAETLHEIESYFRQSLTVAPHPEDDQLPMFFGGRVASAIAYEGHRACRSLTPEASQDQKVQSFCKIVAIYPKYSHTEVWPHPTEGTIRTLARTVLSFANRLDCEPQTPENAIEVATAKGRN